MLKQKNQHQTTSTSHSAAPATTTTHQQSADTVSVGVSEQSATSSTNQATLSNLPQINTSNLSEQINQEKHHLEEDNQIEKKPNSQELEIAQEGSANQSNGHGYVTKHVDFKLANTQIIGESMEQNDQCVEQQEQEVEAEAEADESNSMNSSGHCRLRRRDTPHHLKGARLNSPSNKAQQLDPNEMREILERYTSTGSSPPPTIANQKQESNSPNVPISTSNSNLLQPVQCASVTQPPVPIARTNLPTNQKPKSAAQYIPENFTYQELRKLVQLVIHVNRQEGTGLGIRIAGGKGSSPYKEDDDGIFITRILPDSPARNTGLKVGDKLLKVNQVCLNDLTHQQAADALKEAVKAGTQLTLNVLQELDLNKLFFLQVTDQHEENETSTTGFRINHNYNTYQQREVEVIFVADHKRFAHLSKGDILLQINGINVDSLLEKELQKFVLNSSNPKAPQEYQINYLTIYRPYVPELASLCNGEESTGSQTSIAESQTNTEPIHSSTPMKINNQLESEYEIEDIKIIKLNGAMGLSIVGGGNVACHPFGIEKPGIFISKIVPDGAASRTNLRVGDRILKVNGVDVTNMSHDDCVEELKRNALQVVLLVSHDPQPSGMQEVVLSRTYPEETLGIRINGGIENKSANPYDASDEGIFVVNIIPGTLAHKDGRLQVGTRIMEVSN